MKRIIVALSLISLLLAAGASLAVAGNQAAPKSTPELGKTIGSGKPAVVFFLNPNGGPCQAQDSVLVKLWNDRKKSFNIVYVSAMVQENQKAFYDYGVRSLPSLVLVDKAGNIGRVFPPGIQTYETLASAIDGLK